VRKDEPEGEEVKPEKEAKAERPYRKPTQVGEGENREARENYCKGTRQNDSVT